MSKQDKFFTKVKLFEKEVKITASAISDKLLITGDNGGTITSYKIIDRKLDRVGEHSLKGKMDKILIPSNRKVALILSGGEIHVGDLPKFENFKQIIKGKDNIDVYLNIDDPQCDNILLTITKKKKVKLYDMEGSEGNFTLTEKKQKDQIVLDDIPACGLWTINNNYIYSTGSKIFWVNITTGKSSSMDFENCVQIINLEGKIAVSNKEMTLFMKDGAVVSFNPIVHKGIEFQGYSDFKNHLIALYKNSLHFYTKGEQSYEFAESMDFDSFEGQGRFLVSSNFKVIVITECGNRNIVLDFREKPIEEQIKVLIDQKLFNNGLEKLIENVPEDDPTKPEKIENFFLDCAWACIEFDKKDYKNAKKYISLTNFNPFEFIYMFYDSLSVNIIHNDKKQDIIDHRKENQLLGFSSQPDEEKDAFSFLVSILTIKRNYLLEKYKKDSAEFEQKKLTFMSSKRSKINLSDSKAEITVRNTLDSINSTLIKSLIKLSRDPHEIELALDNESIVFSLFDELQEDMFFKDEKNKNLDETKFTLAYIAEKKGDFETALKEWENFGSTKQQNDKFSLIARERTKKIFYKFKENKTTDKDTKKDSFRNHIKWLLRKYPNEAFEVITKTELVTNKLFLEEIIPEVEKDSGENKIESGSIKEKFLEYCNQNQPTEDYQTQLLQLYADKLFSYKDRKSLPGKLEGDLKKYHEAFMKVIQAPKSCYNKRTILEYIYGSWLKEPIKYLYSQLKEHDKALNELFNDAKTTLSFADLEKYCQENTATKPDIFQSFYKLLSDYVKNDCQGIIDKDLEEIDKMTNKLNNTIEYVTEHEKKSLTEKIDGFKDEIKRLEDLKKPYEQEMLRILKNYGSIKNVDPLFALNYANENWNICENNDFFNYLLNVVKDYTIEGNKYKIAKNFSEMGLVYKEKEAYEFKKKYVNIDSERTCDLCKKKIGNTIFVVYPNLRVYHSKCAANHSIDPMTGVDFSKKRYVE